MATANPASKLLLGFIVRASGLSMEDVCHAAGVPLEATERSEISYADGLLLWEAVATLSEDPIIGHRLGTQMKLHQASVFGPMLAHAEDLRAGLRNVCAILALAMPRDALTWREDEDGIEIRYARPEAETWSRQGVEMAFATIVAIAREASGERFDVAAVELDAPPPEHRSAFDDFYGVQTRFDAGRDRLAFSASSLMLPMIGCEPELARLIVEKAPSMLAPPEFEERALRACGESMRAGEPTLTETARRLGMSPRSLQRRLSSEGTTFRVLRETTARELAKVLLRDPERSIDAIAESLGFSTRGGFDRAFRRWYGVTPARWRRTA